VCPCAWWDVLAKPSRAPPQLRFPLANLRSPVEVENVWVCGEEVRQVRSVGEEGGRCVVFAKTGIA